MDKTTVEKYVYVPAFKEIEIIYEDMSEKVSEQHQQFVSNNITMANHWFGYAGDRFLFAANTLAMYLLETYQFCATSSGVIGDFKVIFDNIDQVMKNDLYYKEQ